MSKSLKNIFSRFTPDTQMAKRIFDESGDAALSGDRERRIYQVRFSLPFIAPKKALYELEDKLCAVYDLALVRLLPNYPQSLFTPDYMGEVYKEARRVGAVTNGFFDNCKTHIEDGVITVSVPFSMGGVELLDMGRAGEIVSGIIRSEFNLNYETVIEQSDDYQKSYEEYINRQAEYIKQYNTKAAEEHAKYEEAAAKRAAEEKAAEEKTVTFERVASLFEGDDSVDEISPGIYKSGRMTFDADGAEVLFGDDFTVEDPTALRAVNRNMKYCVVLGQIFSANAAEMRGSENMTVTIGITDKDSSVFLKTVMPAEQSEGFVKSMKSGMCVAAAGNVRQDKFGEFNLSLKGLKKNQKRYQKRRRRG